MFSSQWLASPSSFGASRYRHARSSASCTMSSAIARSRASQWAKRSSSGRIDSNSRVMGAPASAAGTRPPIEETGDPGSELRMRAVVPEEEDYTHAPVRLRQYRGRLPGLLAQLLPTPRQEHP